MYMSAGKFSASKSKIKMCIRINYIGVQHLENSKFILNERCKYHLSSKFSNNQNNIRAYNSNTHEHDELLLF